MRHPFLDADEILPGLWQGSLPPGGSVLQTDGFHVLVLCARELQLPASHFPGVRVIHAPNDDSDHFPLNREKLQVAVGAARQVAQAIKSGQRALVTCAAGLNRSGLVTALTLHMLMGWPGPHCVMYVQNKRRSSRRGLGALCNNDFVRALSRLDARPKGPAAGAPGKVLSGLWLPR